jgi:hypothetical protein
VGLLFTGFLGALVKALQIKNRFLFFPSADRVPLGRVG